MLAKCPTSLTFLTSVMKFQQTKNMPCIKPALYLCTGELNVRFAGHSKWQNIRHTKAAKDMARSQLFSRIIREMKKATLKGSLDPKLNFELGKAVAWAQSVNMPSTTINRALERFENQRKNPVTKLLSYRGPSGALILITTMTDDLRLTTTTINRIAKKHRFKINEGDPLSAFYSKGWVFAKPPSDVTDVIDKGLEDAIEVGAEEVEPDEEDPARLKFTCELSELQKVKSKLETRNYIIDEYLDMYIPRAPIEIPENSMEALNTLLEEIEDMPEIEKVYVNVA